MPLDDGHQLSVTNPYTKGAPPSPSPSSSPSASIHISSAEKWRQIFPKYAFEAPKRRLTPEHPPGVPSVTTTSVASPTTPTPYGSTTQPQPSVHLSTGVVAPLDQTDEPEALRSNRLFLYRAAVGTCVAVPIIALIPPRKLDLWTFGLGVTFFMTAGFAVEQKTGKGLMWHIGRSLPTQRNRERWKEQRLEKFSTGDKTDDSKELQKALKEADQGKDWQHIWQNGKEDKDAWIYEREAKERRVFEEGQGYGTLIMDQIKEVLGLKSDDDDDDDDENEEN